MMSPTGTTEDFWRLAHDLRAMKIDFNYMKTRKLLDPKWNGYAPPKGHDIIEDDCDLIDANLVTSRIQNSDLHRPVLDIDYGASTVPPSLGRHRIIQLIMYRPILFQLDRALETALRECGIPAYGSNPEITRTPDGNGYINIHTARDAALIPSSTRGHYHLIIGVDLPWERYLNLMNVMGNSGILEHGFANASKAKGYSSIRPPWVHK